MNVNSRSSTVTVEDVEAASNAWDARSIAHDIDTQWGRCHGEGPTKTARTIMALENTTSNDFLRERSA